MAFCVLVTFLFPNSGAKRALSSYYPLFIYFFIFLISLSFVTLSLSLVNFADFTFHSLSRKPLFFPEKIHRNQIRSWALGPKSAGAPWFARARGNPEPFASRSTSIGSLRRLTNWRTYSWSHGWRPLPSLGNFLIPSVGFTETME